MIFIQRPKTIPAVFNTAQMKRARKEIADFYQLPEQDRGQQKLPYVQLGSTTLKQLRRELDKLFNKKCAYCESEVGVISYGDFDHFRPRTSARGLNSEFSTQHYGWLAYTWTNMYLSCQVCNKHKLNWFPVKGQRVSPLTPYLQAIRQEQALLIDPCQDNPAEHLSFLPTGEVNGLSEKGRTTVELLNLNRSALVSVRKAVFAHLIQYLALLKLSMKPEGGSQISVQQNLFKNITEALENLSLAQPRGPYIAGQREIISKWLDKEPDIRDFILLNKKLSLDKKTAAIISKYIPAWKKNILRFYKTSIPVTTSSKKQVKEPQSSITTRINLERIEVKNFKAIEEITISFPESKIKQETWLMFLGENGVGKSSMLQAIALTLMGSKYFSAYGPGLKAGAVLRHESQEGYVKIYTRDRPEPIELNFSSRDNKIRHSHIAPPSFLLAYGSTRLFKTKGFKEEGTRGMVKTKNMFDPAYALTDAQKWMLSIKDEKLFDKVAIAIKDLLLFNNREKLVRHRGKVLIHYPNKPPDTLEELSDGYKSVIAVTVDIMRTLIQANTTMEVAEGVVLLDEIGTHLHPRWRMEVVKRFRNVFPRLQFIVTTHDPLCLRGLKEGEVVVFNKDEHHKVYTIADLPDPSEYRVDQLLTSPFFGLNTVVDPVLEKKFNEYYYLLSKPEPTPVQKTKIEKLAKELEPVTHLGSTWRESLLYKAVDEVIAMKNIKSTVSQSVLNGSAETIVEKQAAPVKTIEEEVKARVREMWNTKSDQKV